MPGAWQSQLLPLGGAGGYANQYRLGARRRSAAATSLTAPASGQAGAIALGAGAGYGEGSLDETLLAAATTQLAGPGAL